MRRLLSFIGLLLFFGATLPVAAQDDPVEEMPSGINPSYIKGSLFQDFNGDGELRVAAFGDSIARGTGDFTSPSSFVEQSSNPSGEAGFPLRIETLALVPVSNMGDPGERLVDEGVSRFARSIPGAGLDVVVIQEGANDAIEQETTGNVGRGLQTMINIARASNTRVVLSTIPPQCCNRSGLNAFSSSYNRTIKTLGTVNELPVADIEHAFRNTCSLSTCSLLNKPEGLHPNISGYDVMGETIMAEMLGINIFAENGPSTLEDALNLTEGSVTTRPDPVTE